MVELTAREDLGLFDLDVVEDGAGLEDAEGGAARVGDTGTDTGLADELESNVEGRLALGQVDRGGAGQGGEERGTDDELHDGQTEDGQEAR